VIFNIDKTWKSGSGASIDEYSACQNKSIETLILENLTVFFNPTRIASKSESILENKPDAITCGNG
jgi:hypothetical protein